MAEPGNPVADFHEARTDLVNIMAQYMIHPNASNFVRILRAIVVYQQVKLEKLNLFGANKAADEYLKSVGYGDGPTYELKEGN